MGLRLLFFTIILNCAFTKVSAQNYPYLNASTGNEEQYIVDADTNIYMYHGDQIEKLTKNFNPIWVKTYTGLIFHNLLLSKTGSIYFIAENPADNSRGTIGKIKSNGDIDWCKSFNNIDLVTSFSSYTSQNCLFYKLMLDRNNNLIFSGTANATSNAFERACLFLKVDTSGNFILLKNFSQSGVGYKKFTVLDDSSGVYRFIWDAGFFENSGAGIMKYSEPLDSIVSQFAYTSLPQFSSISQSMFLKSKLDSNTVYSINKWSPDMVASQHNFLIAKHSKDTTTWIKQITINAFSNYSINNIDEDKDKNLLFTVSPFGGNYFNSQYFKLDSMGSGNQTKTFFSYISPGGSMNQIISAKLNFLYGNHYSYDIYGLNFPSNPLSVTLLDSSLSTNCSTSSTFSSINKIAGIYSMFPTQVNDVLNYSEASNTISSTSVTNYTVNFNYCLALSSKEIDDTHLIGVSPNPTSKTLNIHSSKKFSIIESSIFDINGKLIQCNDIQNTIDVTKLNAGIYFIKIQTDKGEFNEKFIKE